MTSIPELIGVMLGSAAIVIFAGILFLHVTRKRMSKKLVLEFFDYTVKPQTDGLKHVMFRIDRDGTMVAYDWGYAAFQEGVWVPIECPDNMTVTVMKWCEMPSPNLLF